MTRVRYKGNKSPDIQTSGSPFTEHVVGARPTVRLCISLVLFRSQHYYISTGTGYISDVETKTLSASNFISMECLHCSEKSLHSFALCVGLLLLNLTQLAPKQCFCISWLKAFYREEKRAFWCCLSISWKAPARYQLLVFLPCTQYHPRWPWLWYLKIYVAKEFWKT